MSPTSGGTGLGSGYGKGPKPGYLMKRINKKSQEMAQGERRQSRHPMSPTSGGTGLGSGYGKGPKEGYLMKRIDRKSREMAQGERRQSRHPIPPQGGIKCTSKELAQYKVFNRSRNRNQN